MIDRIRERLNIQTPDWPIVPLTKACVKGPQNGLYKEKEKYGTGPKMVHMGNLFANEIIQDNEMQRVNVSDKELNSFRLKEGDLLFARRSIAIEGSGKCVLVGKCKLTDPITFESSIIRVRPDKNKVDSKYLYYFISSTIGRQHMMSITRSLTISGIAGADLSIYFVPLPNLCEQIRISEILTQWDEAIRNTEKLINGKKDIYIGLLQQLLSGNQRFPEFTKSWKTVRLGNIFSNRTETNNNELPLLSITSKGGVVNRDTINKKDSSNKDKSRYLRICPGDIGYNTMRMWQGVSGLSSLEGIVSPAYTVVTPDNSIDAEFMAVFFKYPPIINLFRRYSQGLVDDTLNLKFHHFSKIEVTIPEKEEQVKIASVFKVLDQELVILNKKLDALKEQKKGLMQQLLTGKKRVKVKDVA